MSTLVISDLHVDVVTEEGPKQILKGVNLTINAGRDPRHHGPQRLRQVDAGLRHRRPPQVRRSRSGSVTLDGVELTELTVDERARAGLFLAMQYPVEVPGVSVANFLRTAKTALDGEAPKVRTWVKEVNAALGRPAARHDVLGALA